MRFQSLHVAVTLLGLLGMVAFSWPAARAAAKQGGLLGVGSPAPDVGGVDQYGQSLKLADLKGRKVVLYFYPKDDTPGCTQEAKSFRDKNLDLARADAVVLGVSTDDLVSHRDFAAKYGLPFLLLSDQDEDLARAFGVPVTFGLARRVTFVLDRQGVIARVFDDVTPAEHADEVLAALDEIP
jgi:thioredoxin-dependent peroxiredoxin